MMERRPSRRETLRRAAGGLGTIALQWLLAHEAHAGESAPRLYNLSPKTPPLTATAKNVIMLFMGGAPSNLDLFDPKPLLEKYNGRNAPFEIKGRVLNGSNKVMASPFTFARYGQSGRNLSELLPHFSRVVDEVAFVRSMTTDRIDHSTAQFTFATGRGIAGFPSLGSWVAYGLGTENRELPAFIALEDTPAVIKSRAFGSAWLPPVYNGTKMTTGASPIYDTTRPAEIGPEEQLDFLATVEGFDRAHKRLFPLDTDLESRILNYELAAKMQLSAIKVADVSAETVATKKLYGLEDPEARSFGERCLLARRLVESGVRFVTIVCDGWDHHSDIKNGLARMCKRTDQGTAALLADLKARGLLDSTLVIWSGEFGRLPTTELFGESTAPGRDHNPYGFTLWMAGGGIKAGADYGQTDDLGYAAVENKLTHSDIHATVLRTLGLDYKTLIFPYEGRNESLVGVNPARIVTQILA